MKITKTQLQEIIREEMEALKKEGYGDALDREHEERARERRRQSARIDKERERNRTRGTQTGTPSAWGGGGSYGGGSGKKRFAGFNRDDESADHREDHNIDDLWAMVRNLRRELDDLRDKK